MKTILLTFDVEEFDLPIEFGKDISEDEQFEISKNGVEEVLELLNKNNIKATFFVSAKFSEKYPELIREISEDHEIGLHCLEHKDDYSKMGHDEAYEKIKTGKEIIERIIDKKIIGFRSPRLQQISYEILNKIGIIYDSSLNPTYIPGRYNNFFSPRKVFSKNDIKIIPISVSPILRLPIFWLAFRNFPLFYSKYITNRNKDFVCLVFHSWEFINIENMDLSRLIKRNTGKKLKKKLQKYIHYYKKEKFTTISSYLMIS
ncbi:polysaccharide deacetylase family protein [Candidatus Woesearchaeota archaeon]|nr:polysaccharide deacetylase family protein [Candidatus Woesearchaeota archaeon]